MWREETPLNILALDTSAKAASCAVYKDGILLAESFTNAGLTHSQTIMPMVSDMLSSSRVSIDEIDLFAVSAGPGSFTGLRIGISAVKGMAMAKNKPCAAVSTLEALAFNLSIFNGVIVPVMDARRAQVYTAIFRGNGDAPARLCEDGAISIEELGEKLTVYTEPVMLVGDGAELCYNRLHEKINIRVAPQNLLLGRAASVCAAARRMALTSAIGSAETLAPVYLRLSQAERERMEKDESTGV